ncbi:MAG: ROK family protein [Promethearchaeota archaeon]|nr:MAG: ROK family protein [Candidatus Lokiarchaeota archaeon]
MSDKYIVGVDIGGTWVRVALSNRDLGKEQIMLKKTPTPKENKFSISNAVCSMLNELLLEHELSLNQVIGMGLASAGPLDMEKGELFNNVNLGFKEIPLKQPIQNEFPNIPIYLANDCNAAVLGVHYFEADDDEKDNIVYITISTGIGGGVICNGHLLLGKEGNAAEVGHGTVELHSKVQCNCGAYGCWEAYSSGTGVMKRMVNYLRKDKKKAEILMSIVDNDISRITAKEIFRAAREGDDLSQTIVDEAIYYMKVGIGLINNYYDISTVYLGGAMMKDEDQILPPLIEQFESDPIKFTINHPPKIRVTTYMDDIGLRGALALIKYKLDDDPVVQAL